MLLAQENLLDATTSPAGRFTRELSEEKREKCGLERRYRSTGTAEDAVRSKDQCARYFQLLSTTKELLYSSKILESSGDQKGLFSLVNKLLHRTSEAQLPAYDNLSKLTTEPIRKRLETARLIVHLQPLPRLY